MFINWKIIILIVLVVIGLLINYQKISDDSFIFPKAKNFSLAFISLSKNAEIEIFHGEKTWGWPFGYWQGSKFNFKFLFFNLIFYSIIWGIIFFIIWFFGAFKRMENRRLKPPKFDL